MGVFSFTHDYMANILQFLKFYFVCLVITFSASLAPIIVMVPGDCCFYVYCVNVHFRRKKNGLKFPKIYNCLIAFKQDNNIFKIPSRHYLLV